MRDGKNNKKSKISLKLIMHCQQRVYADMKGLYQQIALLTEVQSQKTLFLKLCIMNALLHFLLCQSCYSLSQERVYGWAHIPFLGLIKKSYHGWLSVMMSPKASASQSCLGLRKPKSHH